LGRELLTDSLQMRHAVLQTFSEHFALADSLQLLAVVLYFPPLVIALSEDFVLVDVALA
jgi:hypothetical protein